MSAMADEHVSDGARRARRGRFAFLAKYVVQGSVPKRIQHRLDLGMHFTVAASLIHLPGAR